MLIFCQAVPSALLHGQRRDALRDMIGIGRPLFSLSLSLSRACVTSLSLSLSRSVCACMFARAVDRLRRPCSMPTTQRQMYSCPCGPPVR